MTDDRFDDFDDTLRDLARDYHRPPETPREAMWARIEAARRPVGTSPAVTRAPNVQPMRRVPRLVVWGAGLAATLLIGVAIGRQSMRSAPDAAPRSVAVQPAAPGVGTGSASSTPGGSAAVAVRAPDAASVASATTRRDPAASSASVVIGRGDAEPARGATAYRLAAVQHIARSDALLTSLRADAQAGRVDAAAALWARDLLGTTRMLMDSPAGDDPQMKKLLDDLELVLVQIVALPATRKPGDLDLIDHAVRQRDVLTRLRTVSAQGSPRAGT